nr:DUF2461 family protein [Bacteroidota bacterium]
HAHIELLKRKSFAAGKHFSKAEVMDPAFEEELISVYLELVPFRRYLNQAVSV